MEVAYGTAGKEWRLMRQRLIEGEEPSLDGKVMCPFCADEMIVQAPNGEEESFYFDVTAHMLSFENSSSGEGGFKE